MNEREGRLQRAMQAMPVLLLLLLWSLGCPGRLSAADMSPNQLNAFRNKATFSTGEQKKFLVVGGILALLTMAGFGYLYGREWYMERSYRLLRKAATDSNAAGPALAVPNRQPLIKSGRPQPLPKQAQPPLNSNPKKEPGKQTQSIWVGNVATRSSTVVPVAGSVPCGVLNIRAHDEFQEVYVDGAFVGMAPARLSLAEGVHVLEFKRAGFKTFRRDIRVIAGAEASFRAVLEPDLPPRNILRETELG